MEYHTGPSLAHSAELNGWSDMPDLPGHHGDSVSPATDSSRYPVNRENQVNHVARRLNHHEESQREGTEPRKSMGVKRACNECRQQKLRCNVANDPFTTCTRCSRLGLECRIDANFKRIEKRRKKHEREETERAARQTNAASPVPSPLQAGSIPHDDQPSGVRSKVSRLAAYRLSTQPVPQADLEVNTESIGSRWSTLTGPRRVPTRPESFESREADYAPLLRQRHLDAHSSQDRLSMYGVSRKIDGVVLSPDNIHFLFTLYFSNYHPFLPFLDPQVSPDQYYRSSRLLFWAIIAVASRRYSTDLTLFPSLCISVPQLLWSTLQAVPQSHHDVKALCLLCTWPFPMSSSSYDPTFMLSGTMMHLAMQIGLHRPSHAQDFSKSKKLPDEDLQDRITTWAICNIVAQSVATGYGQPSMTMYDCTLESTLSKVSGYNLPEALACRLRIEKFCDKITKTLYEEIFHHEGLGDEREHVEIVSILNQELARLESDISTGTTSTIILLYLRCAQVHLCLCTFLDSASSNDFVTSLLSLYDACQSVLSLLFIPGLLDDGLLSYCPNYIFQITLASGFALLKLLRSPFSNYIDQESGKGLFNSAIAAVRKMSVSNNDLPGRLAEVLAQLWANGNRAQRNRARRISEAVADEQEWQELQLKVRSRMSMSIVYDSLWQWRKGFEADDSRNELLGAETSSSDESHDPGLLVSREYQSPHGSSMTLPQDLNLDEMAYDDAFYPMNWILDGVAEVSHGMFAPAPIEA